MTNTAYSGSSHRTFQQALVHEMETNYGFLNSRRVLSMLAEDVQRLIEQFFPANDYLRPGWMVFTGTKATGSKAFPGQQATDLELVTIAWPVLIQEDMDWMASQPDTKPKRWELRQRRVVRIVEHGWQHPQGPVLLTQADLSLMLGLTTVEISQLLQDARKNTGKQLLTKGYFFDQGLRPTHKAQIVTLYEQGMDEATIAHTTQHSPTSVGHYLRDYARVKELAKRHFPSPQIQHLLGMRPSVVDAYLALLRSLRPEFFTTPDPAHFGS